MNHRLARLGVLLLLTSCAGKNIEVGDGETSTPPVGNGTLPPPVNGPEDFPLPAWPAPDACVAQSTLPIVGTWNGYYGRFQNPIADFRVEILGASPAGGLCGTVTFQPGATPPPPPTSYDSVYPSDPGYAFPQYQPPLINGFVFTIVDGRAQGAHASLAVSTRQPWQTWCEHQGSYPSFPNPVDSSNYSCLPNWAGGAAGDQFSDNCFLTNPESNQKVTLNCGRFFLCSSNGEHVCACNAARCVAGQNGDATLEVDFTYNEATGTITGTSGRTPGPSPGQVLLVRVPQR